MARRKTNPQPTLQEATTDDITKTSYEAADADTRQQLLSWFTRGVNDANVYLAQQAGTTISNGYSYPETVWWIKLRQNEQAFMEYERGFVSQAAQALA
jgi:hypothetical protein